ncbi:hypothetical protein E3N88_03949 [Mikania micrantha]|uniref:Uncharacterized protein n=1 Tax=Mikania micrantha TaxID=192012 RepID=A0A5N6PV77_9ASTR|nr:hypothetical protein E3N88_03949 [Mikania micrantha]
MFEVDIDQVFDFEQDDDLEFFDFELDDPIDEDLYNMQTLKKIFDLGGVSRTSLAKVKEKTNMDLWKENQEEMKYIVDHLYIFKQMIELIDDKVQDNQAKQFKLFKIGSKSKMIGRIVSYGYFHNIPGSLTDKGCYVVKRIDGRHYFGKALNLMTLPSFECMELSRLKMIKPIQTKHNEIFEKLLKKEARSRWSLLSPQAKDKIHGYPKPIVFKRPRLRKVEQNSNPYFKFWFYDEKTTEAVILLKQEDQWRVIRMLDPVWIVNCSKDDIDLLSMAEIFAAEGYHNVGISYKDTAVQFQTIA